jgi:hypothetical protein
MKRVLCLISALALGLILLSGCKQNTRGTVAMNPAEGLHPNNYKFSADWPKNEFSKLLPKPDFETAIDQLDGSVCNFVCEATIDQLKEYVESLKVTGFIENESVTEENAFSMVAYSYTASDGEGYIVEVNYSNMLGSLATVTIKKTMPK